VALSRDFGTAAPFVFDFGTQKQPKPFFVFQTLIPAPDVIVTREEFLSALGAATENPCIPSDVFFICNPGIDDD